MLTIFRRITGTIALLFVLIGCSPEGPLVVLVDDYTGKVASSLVSGEDVRFVSSKWHVASEAFNSDTADLLLRIPEDVLTSYSVEMVFKKIPDPEIRGYVSNEVDRVVHSLQKPTADGTAPNRKILMRLHDLNEIELHH